VASLATGVPVLAAMGRDGVYRSQFETGISNGGLTAHTLARTGRYQEQALKRVWHYLARFGSPEMRGTENPDV
jgi:hypothetical protein